MAVHAGGSDDVSKEPIHSASWQSLSKAEAEAQAMAQAEALSLVAGKATDVLETKADKAVDEALAVAALITGKKATESSTQSTTTAKAADQPEVAKVDEAWVTAADIGRKKATKSSTQSTATAKAADQPANAKVDEALAVAADRAETKAMEGSTQSTTIAKAADQPEKAKANSEGGSQEEDADSVKSKAATDKPQDEAGESKAAIDKTQDDSPRKDSKEQTRASSASDSPQKDSKEQTKASPASDSQQKDSKEQTKASSASDSPQKDSKEQTKAPFASNDSPNLPPPASTTSTLPPASTSTTLPPIVPARPAAQPPSEQHALSQQEAGKSPSPPHPSWMTPPVLDKNESQGDPLTNWIASVMDSMSPSKGDAKTNGKDGNASVQDGLQGNAEATEAEKDMFAYHKELLPLDTLDWLTFSFSAMGLVLAAGGGIGGGGILVPLFMILLKFRPKHAIALSNLTIFGGSIANTVFNVQKTRPDGRPLIDWDIIVMMEPSTIAGAVLGSFASKFLPDFILTVALTIVLGLMSYRTAEKGYNMFMKETREFNALDVKTKDTELAKLGPVDEEESERLMPPSAVERAAPPRPTGTPWDKIILLILCFVGCVVLTILKGSGHGSIIGIECGSRGFWILGMGSIPWTLAFGALFRCQLMGENEAKVKANHKFDENDIRWDGASTIKYPLICTIAGLFAGLFGVGGGIVKGPLMLEMGVNPSVAAATAAQMILFTTSAACVSFQIFGLLEPYYGLSFFALGMGCTTIGQIGVDAYMKAARRHSPPVLSIGAVMIVSTILVFLETIKKFTERDMDELLRMSSICSTAS